MKQSIVVRTQFEGFHHWPDAPEEVAFLRDHHRHIFHVRAVKRVEHENRDIEFILFKRKIDLAIEGIKNEEVSITWSCESWAAYLLSRFDLDSCEVSEDGENGALVER